MATSVNAHSVPRGRGIGLASSEARKTVMIAKNTVASIPLFRDQDDKAAWD